MIPRFYHWDGKKLNYSDQEWGDSAEDCTKEMHHFGSHKMNCGCGAYHLMECRRAQALAQIEEENANNV